MFNLWLFSSMELKYLYLNNFFHCFLVFREESNPKAVEPEKEEAHLHHSPDSSFSNSPDPARLGQEKHQGE